MRRWHLSVVLVLGISLAAGCTKRTPPVEEVLVDGDGIHITAEDFEQYLAQIPPYARETYSDEKLLDFFIRGELAYLDALHMGLDRDPEVRRAIDLAVKQHIQREYNRRIIGEKLGIDDAEVVAFFEQHKEDFRAPEQRKCWHILTRTEEDAERARQQVLNGEDFRDVVMRFSIDDETREREGRIGIFSRDQAPAMVKSHPVLLDTLFALSPGHISEVIPSDLGFHVLKAQPAKRMPYKPLDEVAREIRERILVPDSTVALYYQEHQEHYRVEDKAQARIIVAATRTQAERVRERVLSGEDMGAIAKEQSTDSRTSHRGGITDWVRRGVTTSHLEPEVLEMVWDLPEGELGPVVRTSRGYEVFRVERRQYEGIQPLEDVRDRIRSQLLVKAREKAVEQAFQRLRARYGVRIHGSATKAAMLGTPDASDTAARATMNEEELFSLASDQKDPALRLDIYREICVRFPQGERADDSQFMIGFVLLDELGDSTAGAEAYRELLQRFPESDWVDDAKAMLELISPDVQQ